VGILILQGVGVGIGILSALDQIQDRYEKEQQLKWDRRLALDVIGLAASLVGARVFGQALNQARGIKTASGLLYPLTLAGLDIAQGALIAADVHAKVRRIAAIYEDKIQQEVLPEKRQSLEKERDDAIGQVLAGAALNGAFVLVSLGMGAHQIVSAMGRKSGSRYSVRQEILELGSKAQPESIRARLEDPRLTVEERQFLQESLLAPRQKQGGKTANVEEPRSGKPGGQSESGVKDQPLAKEPVKGGHEIDVTERGVELCSPKPCPLLRVEYARELDENPQYTKSMDELDRLRIKDPHAAARRAATLAEALESKRAQAGLIRSLPEFSTPTQKDRLVNLLDRAGAAGSPLGRDQLDPMAAQIKRSKNWSELDRTLTDMERALNRGAGVRDEFSEAAKAAGRDLETPAVREATSILRGKPGTATGGEDLPNVTGDWFPPRAGTAGQTDVRIGRIPGQIAQKMRGLSFKNWDDFRETFWKLVAKDSALSRQFAYYPENLTRMNDGLAPWVPSRRLGAARVESTGGGGNAVYQLDHKLSLQNEGSLYDLGNIEIVTPKFHQEIGE
jgi:hypothetical protein